MVVALMHSQGVLGPANKSDLMISVFVLPQTVSCPVNDIYLQCSLFLCNLNPCLDLEIFPQISQEWEMLLAM